MSKIDKLKLRKIEEVSDNDLKMAPMSYWNGSSGSSGSWLSGGGTSEEDCMSQDMYWELTEQGTSVSNVYVCGIGYVSGTVDVWGAGGSGSDDYGSYGSSEFWSGSSGVTDGWEYGSGPIWGDECNDDSDCGSHKVCESNGNIWPFNQKRCRDMTDKERACIDKEWGSACSYYKFLSTGAAIPVDGTCQSYGAPRLGCTTLNSTPGGKK